MSNFTQSTVIILAADQAAAQADMGADFFTTGASPDGTEPATNYFSAGPWSNTEMNQMANSVAWAKLMYFGTDWEYALTDSGLVMITGAING